mgnify:CR=1 FL=1
MTEQISTGVVMYPDKMTAYERGGGAKTIPLVTPHIGAKELYVTSGHYEKYGADSFQPIKTPNPGEEFFLKPAADLVGYSFLLGGNGWHDKGMSPNVRAIGHVGTVDHNAFNCTPRAVLNVARDSMAHIGFSPATRVFEAAGAAACLITDAWEGIEQFLTPDEEVLVARDGQDVAEHLEELTEERARAIGQAALARVLAEHTYALRGAQVHEIFQQHRQRVTEAA